MRLPSLLNLEIARSNEHEAEVQLIYEFQSSLGVIKFISE